MLRRMGGGHGDECNLIALEYGNIDGASRDTKLIEKLPHSVVRECRYYDVLAVTVSLSHITAEVPLAKKA